MPLETAMIYIAAATVTFFGFIQAHAVAAVAVAVPREELEGDDVDGNYSRGPTLAGTVILALIAFLIFLILLTLVIFFTRKYRKRNALLRNAPANAAPGTTSWVRAPALRVDPHPWQRLPSTNAWSAPNHSRGEVEMAESSFGITRPSAR